MINADTMTLTVSIADHSFLFHVGMADLWQFVGLVVASYSMIAVGAFTVGRYFGFKKGYEDGYKKGFSAKRIVKHETTKCPRFPKHVTEMYDITIAKDENNRVHSVGCAYMLGDKCLKDDRRCVYLE